MVPRRIIRKTGLVFLASLYFIFLYVTVIVVREVDVSWIPHRLRHLSNSSFWIPLPDGKTVLYTYFKCMPFMPKYLLNLLRSNKMRVMFLVGLPQGSFIQKRLQTENDQHGAMGFKWISENCKNAKDVIKIDDDVFVNIFNLIETVLPVVEKHHRHIFCYMRVNNTVARNGRHAVDKHYFSGVWRLPFSFFAGPLLLIPNTFVVKLYAASLTTPFLWLDDVYLFGILPLVKGNVSLFHLPKGHEDPNNALECFSSKAQCDILAAFAWDGKTVFSLWNYNQRQYNERLWRYV
ncbi:hypothetical protein ACJMK2_012554 [Sinanodonta woodiana]|uniref:Hexosyltransferase n=1 Tax=Sinanodonta woodiana TaxID=1069815 RepID=A0ABD3V8L3_SINWO